MLLLNVFACATQTVQITWNAETPVSELSFDAKETICEQQLDRASVLPPTTCNGNEVDPLASLSECTTIIFGLLEGCGLAVGDFEDCVTEMLDDSCALFQQPPPLGCAPLVECLYVPE